MFSTLVVSGGSVSCVVFIGCIKYLIETSQLKGIHTFIGTSFGALLSFMLCLGFDDNDIINQIKRFASLQEENSINIENIINIFYTLGIDNGELIKTITEGCLQETLNVTDITFLDFAKKTGKDLVITACRLRDLQDVYFSVDNTPNVSVIQALLASTAIPILFCPVTIDKELYIDAGIMINFPINYVKNHRLKDVLGICIQRKEKALPDPEHMNIVILLSTLVFNCIKRLNIPVENNSCHIVKIDIDTQKCLDYNFNEMKFDIDASVFADMITNGYNAIKMSFQEHP
jgi:predicted acylesterase/phospholipase RssA